MLGMASEPVFQAKLGQCPQNTAVPSCFLNDVVQKVQPLPGSSAEQETQVLGPFRGPVTFGITGQRPRPAWLAEFRENC